MKEISRREIIRIVTTGCAAYIAPALAWAAADGNADFDVLFAERNEARAVAEKILVRLDGFASGGTVDVETIYNSGGAALKTRYSSEQFGARIKNVRKPLTTMISRKLYTVSGGFRALPNLPTGRYVIVMFDSMFSDKKMKSEEVTLEQKSQGSDWTFVEYYIGPKGIG